MGMSITVIYLVAVVPVLAVAVAAVWPPRPRQVLALLAAPLVTFAGAAGVPPFELLGFYTYIGVAWLVLLVTPLLRWRRSWARVAVPATVLLTCAGLVVLGEGELPLVLFVTLPVLVAEVALVAGLVARPGGAGREQAVEGVVGGSAKP